MRTCAWLALATALAACGGGEFTETSGGTGGTGTSDGSSTGGAGGTGGTGGTGPSGTGGTGVDAASGGRAGAAGTGNGGTGGTSESGGTGGTSETGGTGGSSGSGGQQEPACEGTPFSTTPAVPRPDQPFTLGMTIVGGSDYVCAHLVASCAPLGELSLPFNCTGNGCTGGGMVNCQAGTATAIFYKRRKNPNDACCDGDPNTACAAAGHIEVSSPGTVVAQCSFVVSP